MGVLIPRTWQNSSDICSSSVAFVVINIKTAILIRLNISSSVLWSFLGGIVHCRSLVFTAARAEYLQSELKIEHSTTRNLNSVEAKTDCYNTS